MSLSMPAMNPPAQQRPPILVHEAVENGGGPWLRVVQANLLDPRLQEESHLLPSDTFDCAVFSPPYKTKDGYSSSLMAALGRLLARVMKPSTRMFMDFGQLREGFWRPLYAAMHLAAGRLDRIDDQESYVLQPGQTIAWVKSMAIDGPVRGHCTPLNSAKTLNYGWEYVFTLWKGPVEPDMDKLAVGVPYADKTNLTRGTRGKNGDLRCAGDAWFIPYKTTGATTKKSHVYEFPEELVERCFKVAGMRPGMTIYEPFLGGGTTAVVAKRMGLNVYATERDPATVEAAIDRWSAA